MSRMHTFFHESDTPYGIFYPTNYMVAIFPDFKTASFAARTLRNGGFEPENILAAKGEEVAAHAMEDLQSGGLWGRLYAQISRTLGTESIYADHDLLLAKRGCGFVSAYTPREQDKNKAWAMLEPLNPLVARQYSRMSIELLRGIGADHTQEPVAATAAL